LENRKQPIIEVTNQIVDDIVLEQVIQLVSQAEMAENRKKFFDLAIDMICVADLVTGYFLDISRSFQQNLGYSREELLSRPFIEFIHKEDREDRKIELEGKGPGQHIFHFENRFVTKQGVIRWFNWRTSVPENARVIYGIAHDISAQKKTEERLINYANDLQVLYDENKQSLLYAKRLQEAILPDSRILTDQFPEAFVLYLPKQIVSGDFYWFDLFENEVIISAGDCTGHGVPGALLSVLSVFMLHNSFINDNKKTPEALMHSLDRGLNKLLTNKNTNKSMRDGMDVAICAIDQDKLTLKVSSVNNPVFIVRNSNIIEVNPMKYSMGTNLSHVIFNQQQISLRKNDMIYMISDGFPDQFGGPKDKKFGYRKLRDTLIAISTSPAALQNEILQKTIIDWKNGFDQTDDILLIGIRM
jgi:PAS domain S-box-containing protein